eukprot:COSAG02_NODE_1079_length_14711_cov_86.326512_4_plen_507_part_00
MDTPYAGCTVPECTGVDTPYAGCTVPECTGVDTPYEGCIPPCDPFPECLVEPTPSPDPDPAPSPDLQTGTVGCPCLANPPVEEFLIADGSPNEGLLAARPDGETIIPYPTFYGKYCGPHDATTEPYCAGATGDPLPDAPSWCSSSFCWVDPTNCDTGAEPSSYFHVDGHEPVLYYSYDTCDPESICADLAHDAMACEATGCMYTPGADDVCEGVSTDAQEACADMVFDEPYCMAMGCTFTQGFPAVCSQRPQCGEFEGETGCNAQGGCVWWHVENGPGFCRNDCHTFPDHISCSGTNNGCIWNDHSCAFYVSESDESSESNSGNGAECDDEAVQRLLQLEEEPGICALRNAEVSCEGWVESAFAVGFEMPPGSELLATGCTREACEAAGFGWFDDGSQAGACTYVAHVDALESGPPPGYTSWQEARAHCLDSDPLAPPLMWMTETEVSLRAELGRRDWALDAEQMQKDRVSVIDQLRKENAELVKTVETLTRLLHMAKGRRCFGPQ